MLLILCYCVTLVDHVVRFCSQAFKPVVGKSLLSSVTAVEFLLDRQLDFLSDHSAYQPYQVINTLTLINTLNDPQACELACSTILYLLYEYSTTNSGRGESTVVQIH